MKIAGFIAGDSIKLAGVAYNSHDTVTVKTTGTVSIVAPGTTYNLDIAGATAGETDFRFGTGSVLTKAAPAKPAMTFLGLPSYGSSEPPMLTEMFQMLSAAHEMAHFAAVARGTIMQTQPNAMLIHGIGSFTPLEALRLEAGPIHHGHPIF